MSSVRVAVMPSGLEDIVPVPGSYRGFQALYSGTKGLMYLASKASRSG